MLGEPVADVAELLGTPCEIDRALRLLIELLTLGDRATIIHETERLLVEEAFFVQRSVAVAARMPPSA